MSEHLNLELRHDLPRTTTRKEYKQISRWLRLSARIVDDAIDWGKINDHIRDSLLYGYSELNFNDVLKKGGQPGEG